jgi:hypothetical protein
VARWEATVDLPQPAGPVTSQMCLCAEGAEEVKGAVGVVVVFIVFDFMLYSVNCRL